MRPNDHSIFLGQPPPRNRQSPGSPLPVVIKRLYPLVLEKGHLFIALPKESFLFDTGAPTGFGKLSPVLAVDDPDLELLWRDIAEV